MRVLGYSLPNSFARFVVGVLGGGVLGERENEGEFGPGEEIGETFKSIFEGLENFCVRFLRVLRLCFFFFCVRLRCRRRRKSIYLLMIISCRERRTIS